MLTNDEFLCVRQLQLHDSNGDGLWDDDDDCPPTFDSPVTIGKVLLNATSCLEIEFKQCVNRDNTLVLFLFLALVLLLTCVTLTFVLRAHWTHWQQRATAAITDDDDTKSSSGENTIVTSERSPTRTDVSPDSLERGSAAQLQPDASIFFPSLHRTLEEVRLSYGEEDIDDPKRNFTANESDSVQSPVDFIYDDDEASEGSLFRSNTSTGSRSPVLWAHQREAWEEFEHSSQQNLMDMQLAHVKDDKRSRSHSLPPPRTSSRLKQVEPKVQS